jgi:ribosomal protein S18 acetylase RimI-like enzyme
MHVVDTVAIVGTLILPSSLGFCPIFYIAQIGRHQPLSSLKYRYPESRAITYPRPRLWAVSENLITTETTRENGTDNPTSGCAPLGLGGGIASNSIAPDHYEIISQTLSEDDYSDGFVSCDLVNNQKEANLDALYEAENNCNGNTFDKGDSSNDSDSDKTKIRQAMANKVLLRRVGIAGITKRSSKSNSRRGCTDQSVGVMTRVLNTVRIAALAAASVNEDMQCVGNDARGNASLTSDDAPTAKMSTHKWKNVIRSTVGGMLRSQDAFIQQQGVNVASFTESQNTSPPPGTTSMGVLGEVVQEQFPDIPPFPGTVLVGTFQNSEVSQVTVRSSIPHSSDDTHIANLRLSVFSRFNKEQQRIFRNRSVEVLNIRRRRGAVVLVVEEVLERNRRRDRPYLNDMHSRIEKGREFGAKNNCKFTDHSILDTPSQLLTVRPGSGVTVTSVSSGVAVDISTPDINERSIIGSVECSHQEFRGTMLGNARLKGSLMYVTEVAVRTDARRCGAGVMLMRGVDEVAVLRNVETIYLHVDVTNRAACAMYEKCGYHYLDKREPIYAQFTASLNLHDGAHQGRTHYLMCKNIIERTTWIEDDDSRWYSFAEE